MSKLHHLRKLPDLIHMLRRCVYKGSELQFVFQENIHAVITANNNQQKSSYYSSSIFIYLSICPAFAGSPSPLPANRRYHRRHVCPEGRHRGHNFAVPIYPACWPGRCVMGCDDATPTRETFCACKPELLWMTKRQWIVTARFRRVDTQGYFGW